MIKERGRGDKDKKERVSTVTYVEKVVAERSRAERSRAEETVRGREVGLEEKLGLRGIRA